LFHPINCIVHEIFPYVFREKSRTGIDVLSMCVHNAILNLLSYFIHEQCKHHANTDWLFALQKDTTMQMIIK